MRTIAIANVVPIISLIVWTIASTFFWLIVVGLALWLLSQLFPSASGPQGPMVSGGGGPPLPPLEIAKRRFVRGEITRAEFEQMRRDLAG